MFHKISEAAEYIKKQKMAQPKSESFWVQSLGAFVDSLEWKQQTVPYSEIPYFHETTVEGHEGRPILGRVEGKDVIIQQKPSPCLRKRPSNARGRLSN